MLHQDKYMATRTTHLPALCR